MEPWVMTSARTVLLQTLLRLKLREYGTHYLLSGNIRFQVTEFFKTLYSNDLISFLHRKNNHRTANLSVYDRKYR